MFFGDTCLVRNSIPNKSELKKYLEELESRRHKTKFFLVKILIDLGLGWHSFKEIRKIAKERELPMSHVFSNLIELYRKSGFLETDYKEKYYPRLTSFKIKDETFLLLKDILLGFDQRQSCMQET